MENIKNEFLKHVYSTRSVHLTTVSISPKLIIIMILCYTTLSFCWFWGSRLMIKCGTLTAQKRTVKQSDRSCTESSSKEEHL